MMASNEDRASVSGTNNTRAVSGGAFLLAKSVVDGALNEWYEDNGVGVSTRIVLNATIINALIEHGWGPRPVVSRANLFRASVGLSPEMKQDIVNLFTSNGIEVTDG